MGREFSILPFFHHPNQTPREKTKIYSISSTFPFSIFSLFHYSNQMDLNWAFFLFFLLCLWAKDIWVEINFIFIVFDLVKIEGMENPWGGGGVWWRDKSWKENFVSFLLFGWEWKMGGPVYFPLGTPKLDLSKVQIGEKTGEKIGRN